jgi:uncharacterized repeat protein (TIGR02543 family)
MSTEISFRCGTGISSFVVHVSNDNRFPKTITSTVYQAWFVTTGASCWIDGIVYQSGYSNARAKCASNGNDWNIVSDPSVGTSVKRSITVYASGGSSGYDTNSIYFRVGTGVASYRMQYANATSTGLLSGYINSDYQSTVLSVRDGTDAVLYGLNYESGYGAPYQFVEYTNSAFSSVKKYFAEGDGYVRSNGVRYIALTATRLAYWYRVRAWGNGGTFTNQSGADNYYTALASSTTTSINFNVGTLETPYRAGYTFLGWGYTSNATTYYKDTTIPISATSQSSSSPTIINLYAIWKKTTYTMHIKLGAGVNSASVYVDNSLKADIRDKVYHDIYVNSDSTITVKGIAKATGYGRPYKFNFYQNSTATTPTATLERDMDEPYYGYSTARFYAELVATKTAIDLFYWDGASTDGDLIKKGQPISNLSATRWNKLLAKIQELAEAEGDSYSYSGVSSGSTIYATTFNGARTAISNRTGYGTLPGTQSKGDQIKAALFEGSGSLKSALNAAINHYNNS